MASLDNFDDKEQVILIHVTTSRILANAVAEMTGDNIKAIKHEVSILCGQSIAEFSDSDAKEIIRFAIDQNNEGREKARNDIANKDK